MDHENIQSHGPLHRSRPRGNFPQAAQPQHAGSDSPSSAIQKYAEPAKTLLADAANRHSDYEHNQTGRCRKPVTSQHGKCKCLQALGSVAGRCFIKLGFFSAASICCFRWEKEWRVAACAAWVARAGSSLRIFVGVLRYTCGMRERQPREQAPRGDSEIQDTSWAQAPECTFTSLFFTAASISVRSFLLLSTCSIAWCPGAFGFARARSATCPGGWESASQGGRREMQGA